MSLLKEFKEFAVKGNAVDMAVGIIIGAEFGKIVSSLVSDIIMPPIGLLINGVKFSELFISLNGTHYDTLELAKAASAPTLNYGVFIETSFKFVIVSFSIFLVIKILNTLRKKAETEAPKV